MLLLTLGGSEHLRRQRTAARAAAGLPDVPEDTAERTRTMRASSPPPAPADQLVEAVFGPQRPRFTRVGAAAGSVFGLQRPRFTRVGAAAGRRRVLKGRCHVPRGQVMLCGVGAGQGAGAAQSWVDGGKMKILVKTCAHMTRLVSSVVVDDRAMNQGL